MLELFREKTSEETFEKEQADEHIQRTSSVSRRIQDASMGQQRLVSICNYYFFGTELLWILSE